MKRPAVIGICGRSGSGKSYVCSVFVSFGGYHIDTDAVYHRLLEPADGELSECASAIAKKFGDDVVRDGAIDRRRLGAIVFSDKKKLSSLNKIAHKFIKTETVRLIRECDSPFVLVDAPLLFESGFNAMCDFTVCVSANEATCIERICRRDGITKAEAKRRLSSQIGSLELKKMCDFSVNNSAGRDVTPDVRKILIKKGLIKDEI